MTLSDAIRLGAMMKPQAFGSLRDESGATCAMGAAEDALGRRPYAVFPKHPALRAVCPACAYAPTQLNGCLYTIAHLNDAHHWTREAIADWVEAIERQHAPQAPAPATEPVAV